ncbi:hypothetical protein TeGR_g8989 [Tetraparma gracilis]|uniref:Asparagine synthetase domain-containing protein n=1 Tax=Tetraparma gracilis TaxID=2962635 RepID=A0ABQ6M5Y3_9STRA|nr:hypothetical protein TeGR_g8989 [Tetraparma gracilis]
MSLPLPPSASASAEGGRASFLYLFSSVLSLSAPLTPQPIALPGGCWLQYNGEIYAYGGKPLPAGVSDSSFLAELLSSSAPLSVLPLLSGEFSFLLTRPTAAGYRVDACTDSLGRRSLQQSLSAGAFSLASDLPPDFPGVENVPPAAVRTFLVTPEGYAVSTAGYSVVAPVPPPLPPLSSPRETLRLLLADALRVRLPSSSPLPPTLLFSGGLDSSLLALLLPPDLPASLLSLQLGPSLVPDRVSAILSYRSLPKRNPPNSLSLLLLDLPHPPSLSHLLPAAHPQSAPMDLNLSLCLASLASARRARRYSPARDLPPALAAASLDRTAGDGGSAAGKCGEGTINYNARLPCRMGCGGRGDGGCALGACRGCCLGVGKRVGRFVGGRAAFCGRHAGRGGGRGGVVKGAVGGEDDVELGGRVFLSGLGADELFGGYGRHRTAFLRGGYPEVRRELDKDVARLWERNLMRDDRAAGGHGKELRYPFLDERVVAFACSLPPPSLLDFSLPQGAGDKKILRDVARDLGGEGGRIKRALQFGSGAAKGERWRARQPT